MAATLVSKTLTRFWSISAIKILYLIDFSLCLFSLLAVKFSSSVETIYNFFDVDSEGNLPTWFSSAQFFSLSALLFIFAWLNNNRKKSASYWSIYFLSGIFMAFSLDEVAQMHETIGIFSDLILPGQDRANTVFDYTGVWSILIGVPVLIVLIYLFFQLKLYFRKESNTFWKYLVGLLIFMGGAIGLETAFNFFNNGDTAELVVYHMEELFEMTGVTTMIWAMLELLSSYGFSVSIKKEKCV